MAGTKKTQKKTAAKSDDFVPTFRKFSSMNAGEQDAFRQGAKTVANRVKQNLGLTKPKDKE